MLRELGRLMRGMLREPVTVSRWGGEEFIVIAPETMVKEACELAERLRRKVAEYPFDNADQQPTGHVSLSIGVTTISEFVDSYDALFNLADTALYHAKDTGRNRTVFSEREGKLRAVRSSASPDAVAAD